MQSALMVLRQQPKNVAQRLIDLCGGNPSEAMMTLVEGSAFLFGRKPPKRIAAKLAAISQEIAATKKTSSDAYSFIHRGVTRKGGNPNVRRFL
jgi:hypothetical protein